MKLTKKEWSALVGYFRAEEAVLRDSYGEPGDLEGTWKKNYRATAHPIEYALYEAARRVIDGEMVDTKEPR
jgi:hypothetical protein